MMAEPTTSMAQGAGGANNPSSALRHALPPIVVRWEGDVFRPVGRFARQADRDYVIGETYTLAEVFERSAKTHAHEFAVIREAWKTLPEHLEEQFPNEESLRKRCLILAGVCEFQDVLCSSRAEAVRMARVVAAREPYSLVKIKGNLVRIAAAKSQAYRAMDRKEFQESKTKLLEALASLLGVEASALPQREAA